MHRRFTQFVESPSRDNYLAVRDAVLGDTPLPLAAADLADLVRLLESGAYQEVLDRIDLLPASRALSPRVHFLAAEASAALGDLPASELERVLFVLCLTGLLDTGNGTPLAPYCVCHASDEHDLLEALDLEHAAQTLVQRDGRWLDVVTCGDGRQIWFDVSALFRSAPPRRTRHVTRKSRSRRRRPAAAISVKSPG